MSTRKPRPKGLARDTEGVQMNPFERSVINDYFLEHGYQSQGYFRVRAGVETYVRANAFTNAYADANTSAYAYAYADAYADAFTNANADENAEEYL